MRKYLPPMKCVVLLLTVCFIGCSHPVDIEGNGDVLSASGERDCLLEDAPCTHLVVGNYQESYQALPREGYHFSHWRGCRTLTGACAFDIDAQLVRQWWGATAPPLAAVFSPNGQVTASLRASRTNCVSPCTVVFSGEDTTDTQRTPEQAWHELGYHFDFDDPNSGQYSTTGLSRNQQIGGPLAAHTFECQSPLPCRFGVSLRAQNPEGEYDDAFLTVTVESAARRYAQHETLCVSTTANFEGCPLGAAHSTALPEPDEYSGRHILLRAGDSFDPICIDYTASRVRIAAFGNLDDGLPTVNGVSGIGVDRSCGDYIPNDALIGAIDGSSGYPQRWAQDITLVGLRMSHIAFGMSYTHINLHNIDMLHEESAAGGAMSLIQNASACVNSPSLTCSNVPYAVGAYLSRVQISQSNAEIAAGSTAFGGVNVGAFNCPIINWLTLLESDIHNGIGHNFRSEGTWRSFHGHNVIAGHHYRDPPDAGVRQKITIRACGVADIDPEVAVYRHSTVEDEDGPMTRYSLIADNRLGSTDDFGFGARITMAPTRADAREVVSYGIAERNVFIEPPNPNLATDDGRLSGYFLSCRDNIEATPGVRRGCIDAGQNAVPSQWYTIARTNDVIPPVPVR